MIAFEWKQEKIETVRNGTVNQVDDVYVRRNKNNKIIARITTEHDDIFGKRIIVRLFDPENPDMWRASQPINWSHAETINQGKRWADVNLKHLGYKFVPDKYKVLL